MFAPHMISRVTTIATSLLYYLHTTAKPKTKEANWRFFKTLFNRFSIFSCSVFFKIVLIYLIYLVEVIVFFHLEFHFQNLKKKVELFKCRFLLKK